MPNRAHHRIALSALATMLAPAIAFAHPGDAMAGGFLSGLLHPWTGLDHVAAMIACGVWAMHSHERCIARFMRATAVGVLGGALFGAFPAMFAFGEWIVAGSAVTLGLLAAMCVRVRILPAAVLVAVFCFFHGYVHAVEAPRQFSQWAFTSGFLISMLTLQVLGVLVATALSRRALVRGVGACCAVAGLSVLLVG